MKTLLACIALLVGTSVASAQHGIYFDYHNPSATSPKHIRHPHLDGVLLRFSWKELEPQKGKYNLQPIEEVIAPWAAAGKRVILGVKPAGQDNQDTPEWVYNEVPAITYVRKNILVKVPMYWHKNYQGACKGLVTELGKRYNFDNRVEGFLVGVAHLGFITACPNKEGSLAFLDAGWTPSVWEAHTYNMVRLYQRQLGRKFLFINGSDVMLKIDDPASVGFPASSRYFLDVRDKIMTQMVTKFGGGVSSNGLNADASAFLATGIPQLFATFSQQALSGATALAIHDDWPLWVPLSQRTGVNEGKDNNYFRASLENALGGVRGIPRTNVVWMKLLDTDLQCTDPTHANYQPDCEAALISFKQGLLK